MTNYTPNSDDFSRPNDDHISEGGDHENVLTNQDNYINSDPQALTGDSSNYPFDLAITSPIFDHSWAFNDLESSAILEDQIKLNFHIIESEQNLSGLMNFPWNHGIAWVFSGINADGSADPRICAKPEKPANINGDEAKYLYSKKEDEEYNSFPILPRISWEGFEKIKANYPKEFKGFNPQKSEQGECLGFWQWVIDHPEIPIFGAEGAKKAESLISAGFIAICFFSCNRVGIRFNESSQKHYLDDWWKSWASGKRKIFLAFDGDNQENIKVAKALLLSCYLLKADFKAKPLILSWGKDHKGIDDFIYAQGADKIPALMAGAEELEPWLKKHNKSGELGDLLSIEKSTKPAFKIKKENDPDAPQIVEIEDIGDRYLEMSQGKIAYDFSAKQWMIYGMQMDDLDQDDFIFDILADSKPNQGGSFWNRIENPIFLKYIFRQLKKDNIRQGSPSYVENVQKWIQNATNSDFKQKSSEYTGFGNGILDLKSGKLEDHDPKFKTLFCRDYDFKPVSLHEGEILDYIKEKCPKYFKFLESSSEGNQLEMMRRIAAQKECFYFKLHFHNRFLMLLGEGGSGKSIENRWICNMILPHYIQDESSLVTSAIWEQWSQDRQMYHDVISGAIDLSFEEMPEHMSKSDIQKAKSLSDGGKHYIRSHNEKSKGKPYLGNLRFLANQDFLAVTGDSGTKRRKTLLHFPYKPSATEKNDNLLAELLPEIPAYINGIMPLENLSFSRCEALLDSKSVSAKYFDVTFKGEGMLSDFINQHIAYDPDCYLKNKEILEKLNEYQPEAKYKINGFSAKLKKAFEDFTEFGWDNIKVYSADEYNQAGIKEKVACVKGVRWIREDEDLYRARLNQAMLIEKGIIPEPEPEASPAPAQELPEEKPEEKPAESAPVEEKPEPIPAPSPAKSGAGFSLGIATKKYKDMLREWLNDEESPIFGEKWQEIELNYDSPESPEPAKSEPEIAQKLSEPQIEISPAIKPKSKKEREQEYWDYLYQPLPPDPLEGINPALWIALNSRDDLAIKKEIGEMAKIQGWARFSQIAGYIRENSNQPGQWIDQIRFILSA